MSMRRQIAVGLIQVNAVDLASGSTANSSVAGKRRRRMEGRMKILILTMPELEQAARQWAVDVLQETWEAADVVTDFHEVQQRCCEGRSIILFQQAPPAVLRYALQNGGIPWLLTGVVSRATTPHHVL
jgi:hypothetical protein